MILDWPFSIRCAILFVVSPLIDRFSRFTTGHRLLPKYFKRHLEKFNRVWYLFGWWMMVVSVANVLIRQMDDHVYYWFWGLMAYFAIAYPATLLHESLFIKLGCFSIITKLIAVMSVLLAMIMGAYHTYQLFNQGYDCLANQYIWKPLLGIYLIYRFRLELMIQL